MVHRRFSGCSPVSGANNTTGNYDVTRGPAGGRPLDPPWHMAGDVTGVPRYVISGPIGQRCSYREVTGGRRGPRRRQQQITAPLLPIVQPSVYRTSLRIARQATPRLENARGPIMATVSNTNLPCARIASNVISARQRHKRNHFRPLCIQMSTVDSCNCRNKVRTTYSRLIDINSDNFIK